MLLRYSDVEEEFPGNRRRFGEKAEGPICAKVERHETI